MIESENMFWYWNFCIEQRKSEADRIRERYPDRIPVICEKSKSSKLPDIDKTKWVTPFPRYPNWFRYNLLIEISYRYLVPNDLTAYHFNYIIRKRIKLPEKDSLYFFVNGRNLLKGGKKQCSLTLYNERLIISESTN